MLPPLGPALDSEAETDAEFEALIEYLRRNRGFDFTGYKRTSLIRRTASRMRALGIGRYPEYAEYCQQHSDEFGLLLSTILINVTAFFRDPAAWAHL